MGPTCHCGQSVLWCVVCLYFAAHRGQSRAAAHGNLLSLPAAEGEFAEFVAAKEAELHPNRAGFCEGTQVKMYILSA